MGTLCNSRKYKPFWEFTRKFWKEALGTLNPCQSPSVSRYLLQCYESTSDLFPPFFHFWTQHTVIKVKQKASSKRPVLQSLHVLQEKSFLFVSRNLLIKEWSFTSSKFTQVSILSILSFFTIQADSLLFYSSSHFYLLFCRLLPICFDFALSAFLRISNSDWVKLCLTIFWQINSS